MKPEKTTIEPGATIGILGGGQLGRMLSIAAAQLGYRCHIFAPEENAPATDVSAEVTRAAYDDLDALKRFGMQVDIVTYEFENIDSAPVAALSEWVAVRPSVAALEVAQDRLAEKDFVSELGGSPAPYRAVSSREGLDMALAGVGTPAILKTRRFGYDGKGQARIMTPADTDAAWNAIGSHPAVLEGLVTFEREFSVILARGVDGQIVFWDSPDNEHRQGILAQSTVPARAVVAGQVEQARALAAAVAEALNYAGVLTLEFFAGESGPVFNEMAPRVHNSGHWTIEGARTSQFENHIRAVCGLPLGATDLAAPGVRMANLIGGEVHDWPRLLADPHAHLHLYGKGEARPGRKMGHVTWVDF